MSNIKHRFKQKTFFSDLIIFMGETAQGQMGNIDQWTLPPVAEVAENLLPYMSCLSSSFFLYSVTRRGNGKW